VSLFVGDTALREALPNLVGSLRHLDEPRLETVEFVRSDTVNSQADHVRKVSESTVTVSKKEEAKPNYLSSPGFTPVSSECRK
jgi:hypothetical protein